LAKGSHVNVVGRVQNNNYERDGETVYTMAFTAEEVDYLDTKAESEALRERGGQAPDGSDATRAPSTAPAGKGTKPTTATKAGGKKAAARQTVPAGADDDIPF
jgi:single-stranded DNA-binding protein